MKVTSKDGVNSLIPAIRDSASCNCRKYGWSAASTCDKYDRWSKYCECDEK